MGRSENGEGSVDLRRSTRKRTLKRDIDSDYDYDYHRSEFPSTSTFPPIPITTTPKIENDLRKKSSKRTKVPALEGDFAMGQFSDEIQESMHFSNSFLEGFRSIDPVKERQMLDSLVKLETPDLRNLNSSDIIDIHCQNLKRRMESITHLYLESRSVSPPETVAAEDIYYEDDDYEELDSDELTVNMVVNELVDTVVYYDK